MQESSPWLFWALLSAFFAALTAIFAKLGLEDVNSDVATLVRTLVIVGMLTSLLGLRGQLGSLASISGKTFFLLGLSGLATGASWVCYFRALQLGSASRVAPVDKLSVVLVAVFGVLFLGENLGVRDWIGIAMIAGGAILLALS